VRRPLLRESLDFFANTRGERDASPLHSLRLMRLELDLPSSLTVMIDNIAKSEVDVALTTAISN
jgi:hypothetical protein